MFSGGSYTPMYEIFEDRLIYTGYCMVRSSPYGNLIDVEEVLGKELGSLGTIVYGKE